MKFNHQSSPGFAISRTSHLLRAAVLSATAEIGWEHSPEETQALIALSDADRQLSMGEFAAQMLRDATTLKRQLDGLVEKGLVHRSASTADGRVVLVSLTRLGQAELERVIPILEDVRRAALDGLSADQIETTIHTLQQMQENLMSRKRGRHPGTPQVERETIAH